VRDGIAWSADTLSCTPIAGSRAASTGAFVIGQSDLACTYKPELPKFQTLHIQARHR
jgi:hypothetical protein